MRQAAQVECLEDYGDATCAGTVEHRMPMSGTGRAFPRCEKHWEERLETQEGINRRYGGVAPPADFDPATRVSAGRTRTEAGMASEKREW